MLFSTARLLQRRNVSDACRALVLAHLANANTLLSRLVLSCEYDAVAASELLLRHCEARAQVRIR